MVTGDMEMLPVHEQVLAFVRKRQGAQVLCVFNFNAAAVAGQVILPPWGGLFASL